jgi:hypothetical protein
MSTTDRARTYTLLLLPYDDVVVARARGCGGVSEIFGDILDRPKFRPCPLC